jgi:hypothetical protein
MRSYRIEIVVFTKGASIAVVGGERLGLGHCNELVQSRVVGGRTEGGAITVATQIDGACLGAVHTRPPHAHDRFHLAAVALQPASPRRRLAFALARRGTRTRMCALAYLEAKVDNTIGASPSAGGCSGPARPRPLALVLGAAPSTPMARVCSVTAAALLIRVVVVVIIIVVVTGTITVVVIVIFFGVIVGLSFHAPLLTIPMRLARRILGGGPGDGFVW